jgi:hypothetical protein
MANSCSRPVALEIERRFLVAGDAWRAHVRWSRHLQQGYLSRPGEGLTLRVRVAEQAGEPAQAWLTLKAPPLAAPPAPAPAPLPAPFSFLLPGQGSGEGPGKSSPIVLQIFFCMVFIIKNE